MQRVGTGSHSQIHLVNILKDLFKHTEASHPDYSSLSDGLKALEASAMERP